MEKLINIGRYPISTVLDLLLQDKSTKKNIIWATDTYEEFGEDFSDKAQMYAISLKGHSDIIRPRIQKSQEAQALRTRKRAEVFTPSWLCNRMNNHVDEEWFGRTSVFNTENEDYTWTVTEEKVEFPKHKKWQNYVDSRRLEIACGEAPYLVSRYDASTGELIVPPMRRIGILDRKLRIVNENTDTYDDWLKWTIRAFEATYGYEYQGDNVLIARANLLLTFVDYYEERWNRNPDGKLLMKIANKIAWNIWQMDGLKDTVPLGKPYEEFPQYTLFDMSIGDESDDLPVAAPCRIYDWRGDSSLKFMNLKEMGNMEKKLFDYVIGNPPYQENTVGTSDKPVYNYFYDAVSSIADIAELITPARFLFNAGKTPKEWNEKMLSSTHFKVLWYNQNSADVFPSTDIKGGVCVGYWQSNAQYEPVGIYSVFEEMNSIKRKVSTYPNFQTLDDWIIPQNRLNLDALYADYPQYKSIIGSFGKERRLTTSIFSSLDIFHDEMQDDDLKVLGLIKNQRVYRYVQNKYIEQNHDNLSKWKVMLPKSNGSGAIGEVLSTPLCGTPLCGYTQSFIGIGTFDTEDKATACLKYIKTKFARVCLGILKITQDNNKGTWKYVPLQDFTENSDIDWSQSVADIDRQLYAKYGLDEKEIAFIESHVKEMA